MSSDEPETIDAEIVSSDRQPLSLPVVAQLAVVNNMVLPLLKRTGIDVTVNTSKDGMALNLRFVEPAEFDGDNFGTDDPDNARMLWALRERIEKERARAEQPASSV